MKFQVLTVSIVFLMGGVQLFAVESSGLDRDAGKMKYTPEYTNVEVTNKERAVVREEKKENPNLAIVNDVIENVYGVSKSLEAFKNDWFDTFDYAVQRMEELQIRIDRLTRTNDEYDSKAVKRSLTSAYAYQKQMKKEHTQTLEVFVGELIDVYNDLSSNMDSNFRSLMHQFGNDIGINSKYIMRKSKRKRKK